MGKVEPTAAVPANKKAAFVSEYRLVFSGFDFYGFGVAVVVGVGAADGT
jgi:hypothetical protein